MEPVSTWTVFGILLITLITVCSVKVVALLYQELTYWKKRGVPYMQATPLLGMSWQVLLGRVSFPDYLSFLYYSHPDAAYIGGMENTVPLVIFRDPKLIREVSVKYFDHFPNHRSFIPEEMDPIFGRNVFSLLDNRWRDMRNTLSPFFTSKKMRFMFGLVSKCSHDFVDCLHQHPELCSMVDIKDYFRKYTNDVIASVAFGINLNSLNDPENEFYKAGTGITDLTSFIRMIKIMLFRLSPRLWRMTGLSLFSKSGMKFFYNVISESVRARDEQGFVRLDMIHLLIQARDREKHQSVTNIDDIVAQTFIFFFAGFDTMSTLLAYLTYELALNQDIQEKLREEVDHYMTKENEEITYETLSKMEYLEMVVSETHRKYPVVITDRVCTEKFELPPAGPGYNKTTVNPNDSIWIPIYALHHDPKYFPNPDKFDPERFNEENKRNIVPYTYMPFGVGPRMCMGNRLSMMEAKIVTVHLLRKFFVLPNEKTKPVRFKKGGFALIPIDGLFCSFKKRDP
ncbi:Cytochrome P450 9e2 [Dufourea novaeangliae]|uniref:Cytochrome P450 9e2 n=1 Tax=Dufourea novaeangliae TaxID=178035 RepID=A0A154P2W0_DUFNO|nr:Cytochrome P450 9e2 [Dufourea novaeangliae]